MRIFELSQEEKDFIKNYKFEMGATGIGGALGYLALADESAPLMAGSLGALSLAIVIGGIRTWREASQPVIEETQPSFSEDN